MTHDYLSSWLRSKRSEINDLIQHIEMNDVDDICIKEYLKEIKDSFSRKVNKL